MSNNNPVYTYQEKQKMNLGSKKRKIGIESLRKFNQCALCLSKARNPVITESGIIFCRECIYADLLSQKQEIKKSKESLKLLKLEQQNQRKELINEAKRKILNDFEKTQNPLSSTSNNKSVVNNNKGVIGVGDKRKLSSIQDLQTQAEEEAIKQIEREQLAAKRSKLPSFWLSSLTPQSDDSNDKKRELENMKMETICRQANPPHSLSLKQLFDVKFKDVKSDNEDVTICASCTKTLNNSTNMFISKKCGNIICKICVDTLYKPNKQCPVCDNLVDNISSDLIKVSVEGTGFASGGQVQIQRRAGTINLN